MRIAISNIAWDLTEDSTIADLLRSHQIDAIDIAPGKYFSNFSQTTEEQILTVKKWWKDRGIEIMGMQALLFGTTGLNVFGSNETQERFISHLASVCRIGGHLGAKRLVFGSPKNRDRMNLSDHEVNHQSVSVFRQLGDIAASHGTSICLEPNPTCYGANFMTTTEETAHVVTRINHPAIKMQLDTGALAITGEDPESVLKNYSNLIGHIHASEPSLVPLGDGKTDHSRMAKAIRTYLPESPVSIEMLGNQQESHFQSIDRALQLAIGYYG
jgi:D-psicose/D-tagatose/L-ribulose 3-epimerase